ncbi:MAG: ABC transporter ATP-binding protein [Dehalococcoidia bacterium]
MSTIEVNGLTKRYEHVIALEGLTFTLDEGIVGLMGANGAGKSTLIKILLGLLYPTSGTARVFGLDATTHGLHARERIGYMPEHDCLPPDMSAFAFVTHMAQLSGLPPREAAGRTADTLRYVGLDEERYRPIGGYSTGMKQRVKFAQALVHDPRILFLDEPTNGLDPSGREQMLDLIQRTSRDGTGLCIVMSTHLLADVEHICDQVVVLDGGRLIHSGSLASFSGAAPFVSVSVGPDGIGALAGELGRRGLTVHADTDHIVVDFHDDHTYDVIRDTVAELGLPLLRMARRRTSLADLFRSPSAEPGALNDGDRTRNSAREAPDPVLEGGS